MKIYSGKIPFQKNDAVHNEWINCDSYVEQLDYDNGRVKIWKDNIPFVADITINSYSRGRSAANWDITISSISCPDKDYEKFLENVRVNVFMKDMLNIILNTSLINGKSTSLNLVFCKRGSNYGMCLQGCE